MEVVILSAETGSIHGQPRRFLPDIINLIKRLPDNPDVEMAK